MFTYVFLKNIVRKDLPPGGKSGLKREMDLGGKKEGKKLPKRKKYTDSKRKIKQEVSRGRVADPTPGIEQP